MHTPYPVVAEHVLPPVPRRRFLARRRPPDEVPQALTGQRLVYFSRGTHVLDDVALQPDSPTVVDASRVSVIDITSNTAVVVPLTVPSQDATTFTLHATFLCTVHDPVAVVRTGGHHAETMLSGYLRAYHQMFEAGLDFALRQVNDARRKLSALVRAYTMVTPPRFTGMTATLANVEVSTPDEVARFQESLRGEHHRHKVDMVRQRHEQALASAARDYERDQLRSVSNAISDDPIAALTLSYTAGDITALELATALVDLRHREVTRDHEDLTSRLAFDRERERAEQAWQHETHRLDHEERRHQLDARREFIREATKQGHLDTVPVQLDKLVNDFLGTPAWPQLEPPPEDEKVRVEDAH